MEGGGGAQEGGVQFRVGKEQEGKGAANELLPSTSVTRLSLESAVSWLIGCQVVAT